MCEIRSLKGHGARISISEVIHMSQVWHPKCLPGFMAAVLEFPLAVRQTNVLLPGVCFNC